jgi:hypothetical protein
VVQLVLLVHKDKVLLGYGNWFLVHKEYKVLLD